MPGPRKFSICLFTLTVLLFIPCLAQADDVTDWNQEMLRAGIVGGTAPVVMTRNAAIVQASVFDAVNGIDRKFMPIHVPPAGPAGASRRAAAVQAAYTALVALYPTQKQTFDARLATSLTAIAGDHHEAPAGIAAGVTWGTTAANGILAWRSTDGFTPNPPPFTGGTALGQWRPTPPAFSPGVFPQFATMATWVLGSQSQFRPADGPPPLTGAAYATDFNETKLKGRFDSTLRTPDQTVYAWFWQVATATYLWNHLADTLIERRARGDDDDSRRWGEEHHSLLESARILALLDIAMADAAIACWDAKYHYVAWRPVTAIPIEATIGNPGITVNPGDDTWMPLFATPGHPEYPSAHATISSAATVVLASVFGEDTPFTMDNDLLIGVTRSFHSFSQALDEVNNARVFAGIHFRFSCNTGTTVGTSVGHYVLDNALLPAH